MTPNKVNLVAKANKIVKEQFKMYPFKKPFDRFSVASLKEFIRLYSKGGDDDTKSK